MDISSEMAGGFSVGEWNGAVGSVCAGPASDWMAIQAGLTLPWSNGVTEGQVNRLKLLKRQAYGHAHVALLRQRILLRDITTTGSPASPNHRPSDGFLGMEAK